MDPMGRPSGHRKAPSPLDGHIDPFRGKVAAQEYTGCYHLHVDPKMDL